MNDAREQDDKAAPVSLADEDAVRALLVETVFDLWGAVNNLTRLRPSKHEAYRVTIFGSARAQPGTFAYEEVKRLATALAEMGCKVNTGGGPGLMQAANEGAAAASGPANRSIGIRVNLPFEQSVNPFVNHAFEHQTFFTRLHHFVLASDAYVVVPGGIGTVLELTMIWQLLQVKHIQGTPLILVGAMWTELVDWARTNLLKTEPPLANPEDLDIPICLQTADEAIALLREHHARWASEERSTNI